MAVADVWSTRAGTGPPLVLLHGIGATHDDFRRVHPLLCERFDVVSVDLPGHGRSPAPRDAPTVRAMTDAVERHVRSLGLTDAHLLGNSLGGRIALELAVRGRARSVVAISPFGPAPAQERMAQVAVLAGAGLAMRALRPWSSTLSERWWGRTLLLGGVRTRPWRAHAVEAVALNASMASPAYWRTLAANVADVPRGLDAIGCPVTLVQGTADLLSGGQTLRYSRLVPGAKLVWLFAAGHSAHGDRPHAVAEIVATTAARADAVDVEATVRVGGSPADRWT